MPKKRQPRTARAIHANAGVHAKYRDQLDKLVREMSKSVEYWLEAAYKTNPPRMELAMDALPSKEMSARIKELAKRWVSRFNEMAEKIADNFVRTGAKHTDASFQAALRDAGFTVKFQNTPIVRDAINASIQENVALIKSIPQHYMTEVEGIVMRGYTRGRDLQYISDELRHRYGVTKRRAALIARDQSNKLNATITQARRVELGLFKAIWVHSGGGKEPRHSHVKAGRDKLEFDVREGAYIDGEYILPGELINCLCTSKTVLPF